MGSRTRTHQGCRHPKHYLNHWTYQPGAYPTQALNKISGNQKLRVVTTNWSLSNLRVNVKGTQPGFFKSIWKLWKQPIETFIPLHLLSAFLKILPNNVTVNGDTIKLLSHMVFLNSMQSEGNRQWRDGNPPDSSTWPAGLTNLVWPLMIQPYDPLLSL